MGRKVRTNLQLYDDVHNFARTMQGQLKIRPMHYEDCRRAEDAAQRIYDHNFGLVRARIMGLSDETQGKLAAAGFNEPPRPVDVPRGSIRISLASVSKRWFGPGWPEWSGAELLRQLACFAVIAAMADNVWYDLGRT
jgi:hypothetical protein